MHFSALFFVGSEQVNSGLINAYLKSTRRVQQKQLKFVQNFESWNLPVNTTEYFDFFIINFY